MVQVEGASVAVLSGDFQLRVQLLEDGLHVVGIAGLGDGVDVGLSVHANLVLLGHIQQIVQPPASDKVLSGDTAGIIAQRQLVHLVDTQLIQGAVGVLLHRDGVAAAVRTGGGLLSGKGRDGQGAED